MKRVQFNNRRGQQLVGVLHGEPNGRAVVSCHGMLSGKDGVKHTRLADELGLHGVPLLRFDFAGRGESEGDVFDMSYSNDIEDVDAAIDWLQKQGVTRVGLFGSSMGGAVALLAAARDERIVTIATLAAIGYPAAIADRYPDQARAFEVQGFVDSPVGRIGRGFMDDAVQHDVVSAVSIVRAPILVMHGTDDTVVPQTDALDIATAALNASLDLVDGGDHQFHNEQLLRPAMRRIAEFLVAHL
jgi:pimeloyl-ACP methyl ester carboxylesterase